MSAENAKNNPAMARVVAECFGRFMQDPQIQAASKELDRLVAIAKSKRDK